MYRLVTGTQSTAYEAIAKVAGPWGPAVQADLPEVEQTVRFRFAGQTLVGRGEARFYESGAFYTDPAVFQVFSFPLLQGDPRTALAAPNSVVLTASVARKYFGDDDPLGQALTFDGEQDVTVTGVMADVPAPSHFTFPFLLSRASEPDSLQYDWGRTQYYTYLLLAPGTNPDAVTAKIPAVLAKHLGAEEAAVYAPRLQAVADIHLHSNLFREMAANADITYVYLFIAVAFFILLIACINFMNLATARSARRAKEVGVRKAAGAGRSALVRQFLGESLLMSLLALVMALDLVSMLLPAFNTLTGKTLEMSRLLAPAFTLGLAGLTLFVGVVSGSYPAFVLASYRPMEVLKGRVQGRGHAGLRKGLVVFQFAVSVFLIIAAVVVQGQLRTVRIRPERMDETLAALETTWAQFEPDHPFTYSFLDEQFARLYLAERGVGTLLGYATILAIFIACLGLFGLASFTAEQRTKELGIRKVLGATVGQIVLLLSKDFARLVVLALVVAAPVAYFAMEAWLAGFAYHAALSAWIFITAGGAALLVALLTVSYQAIRAALADPVKSLRYE